MYWILGILYLFSAAIYFVLQIYIYISWVKKGVKRFECGSILAYLFFSLIPIVGTLLFIMMIWHFIMNKLNITSFDDYMDKLIKGEK